MSKCQFGMLEIKRKFGGYFNGTNMKWRTGNKQGPCNYVKWKVWRTMWCIQGINGPTHAKSLSGDRSAFGFSIRKDCHTWGIDSGMVDIGEFRKLIAGSWYNHSCGFAFRVGPETGGGDTPKPREHLHKVN